MANDPGAQMRARLKDPRRAGKPVPAEEQTRLLGRIFEGLPDAERERAESQCEWTDYPTGAAILQRTDKDSDVLFIQRGRVRVTHFTPEGHVVIFGDLGEGETVGDFAAIDDRRRSADVYALVPTRVARMSGEDFLAWLRDNPDCMMAQMRKLTAALRDVSIRLSQQSPPASPGS